MTTKSGTKNGDATQRRNDATESSAPEDTAQQIYTAHQIHTLAHLVYRHLMSAAAVPTSAQYSTPTDGRQFGAQPLAPGGFYASAMPAPAPLRTLFYWYP